MYQQEIKFFWSLTEQIPLDLDYSDCHKPQLTVLSDGLSAGTGITFTAASNTWSTVTITGSQLDLDVNTIEFKLNEKPNLFRRAMYKLMGLKWKTK
jgi:hypothetical protein